MDDRLLLEESETDGYLLEDGTGVLLREETFGGTPPGGSAIGGAPGIGGAVSHAPSGSASNLTPKG
jgi:hypothetical protein